MSSISYEKEEQEIFRVISDALLCLCEQKPNDPIDFLSRKMLELIGDDPSLAVRKKNESALESQVKVNENIIISPERIAIQNLHQKFEDNYKVIEAFSNYSFLVQDLSDPDNNKACRIIDKKKSNIILSDQKIKMLVNLDHPNIIRISQILEDEEHIYVISDFCPGKDIFTFLVNHRSEITEELIRTILNQILTGLSYLHQNNIVHKNIQPSKILVAVESTNPNEILVKISDFITNSEYYNKGELTYKSFNLKDFNPLYIAPELIEGKYDNKVDIWNFGLIAYILLIGEPPFKGKPNEILYKISHKKVRFPDGLSDIKYNFLSRILNTDPNDRDEASALLKDDFFMASLDEVDRGSDGEAENNKFEIAEVMNNMAQFTIGQNLRRSVLSYMVSRKLYDEGNAKMRKIFDSLDVDHDGTIEKEELFKEYRKLFPGTSRQQWERIKKFIDTSDVNKDGKIQYGEFLTVMTLNTREVNNETLKKIFNYFDKSGDGYIEALDLKELFEDTNVTDAQIHEMLDEIDKNGDRKVSFEEFKQMMTGIEEKKEVTKTEESKAAPKEPQLDENGNPIPTEQQLDENGNPIPQEQQLDENGNPIPQEKKEEGAEGEVKKEEEVKQEEVQQEEAKHEEVKHEEVKHEEVKHEEVKHEEAKHEEVKHEEAKHEEAKHEEAKEGEH